METVKVKIWVCVDANGDCDCGPDDESALQRFDENIGGTQVRRLVQVELEVPFSAPVLRGKVPAEGDAILTVG